MIFFPAGVTCFHHNARLHRVTSGNHAISLGPLWISSPAIKVTEKSPSKASYSCPVPAKIEGNVILFDGVCNFCNAWVDILLRVDINKRFKFAPLQSEIGQSLLVSVGKEADDISSVVLVQKDMQFFDKSSCVLKVVEELGPLAGLFSNAAEKIVPRGIRDSIYDTVAENRYNLMGKRDECRCGDPQFADRFIS